MSITKSDWLGDWFSLDNYQTAQPEGTSEEWRQILAAIKQGKSCSFRRVACWPASDGGTLFCSPRNSIDDFEWRLDPRDVDEFIADAEQKLDEFQGMLSNGAGI